jgi:type II secretory pathway pseudopilin PulG
MTRPISAPSSSQRTPRRDAGGFTLIEMLVVLGIIIILIGLLSPMIVRAYRNAERARVTGDLNAIVSALEAYKLDFGRYIPAGTDGANALARGLIGAGTETEDGYAGPGFRVTRFPGANLTDPADDELSGKVYPPYLAVDRFKMVNASGAPTFTNAGYIADRYRKPILYYVAQGKPNINLANGFCAANSSTVKAMWNSTQNAGLLAERRLRPLLGDVNDVSGELVGNGQIDVGETAAYTGPFILLSCGPDEVYGVNPADGGDNSKVERIDIEKCDDITNFRS